MEEMPLVGCVCYNSRAEEPGIIQENLPLVLWVVYELMSSGLQRHFFIYLAVILAPRSGFDTSLVAYITYLCTLTRLHLSFCGWFLRQWGYCHFLYASNLCPLDQICQDWIIVLVNHVRFGLLLHGKLFEFTSEFFWTNLSLPFCC